ncbi:MAG: prolyl oligopeptidase family serine peptidase [Anaerolineales bacterium]
MPGDPREQLLPKYERQGWPAEARPDTTTPPGWSHALLVSIDRPRGPAISPDGRWLAFFWDREDQSDLYILETSGGWPRRLTFDRTATSYWLDEPARWSPDGHSIAYTDDGQIWIINVDGRDNHQVTDLTTSVSSVQWMPDNQHLVFTTRHKGDLQVMMIDIKGQMLQPISQGPGLDHSPEPSPDGKRIAFIRVHLDDLNRSDLMLADLERGGLRQLTNVPGFRHFNPRWSPDGKWIAYLSERTGSSQVFLMNTSSWKESQLTDGSSDYGSLSWAPDSNRLVCTCNRRGALDLHLLKIDGGASEVLRSAGGVHTHPGWNPAGTHVFFGYEDPTSPHELYRLRIGGKTPTRLTYATPPLINQIELVKPTEIEYTSLDGEVIPACIYKPRISNGAAIVYPHGGPAAQFTLEWYPLIQYFVAKGYTWLAPNFRGSTGYGLRFERLNHGDWGGGDVQDCLAAADYLAGLNEIDGGRIGIFGASYGSYLAVCALAFDPHYRYACGVAKYGDSNLVTAWAEQLQVVREDQERMMGRPDQNRAAYIAGSPIHRVANIRRPLLIVHGLLDETTHALQSEELVEALNREGKTFEYKTYADEGHGLSQRINILDFNRRLERFLDWYLL